MTSQSSQTTVYIWVSPNDMRDMPGIQRALESALELAGITDSSPFNVELVESDIDSTKQQRILLSTQEDVALFMHFMDLFKKEMRDIVGAYPPDCVAYTTAGTTRTVCTTSCSSSDAELYNELLGDAVKKFMALTGRVPPMEFSVNSM